jgi:serine/threonine-protein kinase ATR
MMSSDCNIPLPPSNGIGDFWPDSQKEVALPQGCQKSVTSRVQAIQIGILLLQSLLECRAAPFQSPDIVSITSDTHIPWTLDSCLALWQSFKQSCGHLGRGSVHDCVETIIMQILEAAALPCLTLAPTSPNSSKAIVTLTTAVSDLLQSCSATPYLVSNQIRLASLLARIRGSVEDMEQLAQSESSRHRNLKNFITDNLAPGIIGTCEDTAAFNSLERDLQVRHLFAFKLSVLM